MSSLRLALKQSLAESAQIQLQRDVERRRLEETQRRKKERRQEKKRKDAQQRRYPLDKASRQAQQDHSSNDDDNDEEEMKFSGSSAAAADVDEDHSAAGVGSYSSSRNMRLSVSFDEDRSEHSSEQEMQFADEVEGGVQSLAGNNGVKHGKGGASGPKKRRKSKDGILAIPVRTKSSGADDLHLALVVSSSAQDPSAATRLMKKKKKRRPASTVAKPAPRVLAWVRGISKNKQRRYMKEGLRVKVSLRIVDGRNGNANAWECSLYFRKI